MKVCVLIELDDQGQYQVGTYQGDLPDAQLQPVKDANQALQMAGQLLQQGGQAASQQPQGNDQDGDEDQGDQSPEDAMTAGYNSGGAPAYARA